MKSLFILIMAASGLFFGQTTEDTAPVVGAQIEVQSDTYDFGEIQKGADGTCVFTLKNVGFEPLIISKCDKTCGCTVPSCDNDPVLPGGTTEVTVKYDTQRVGPFQKSVKVHSNAENQPLLILKIKGTVLAN